jgi:hypothetical protein
VTFKKRAPRAIKEIKAFATKAMVCSTNADPSMPSNETQQLRCRAGWLGSDRQEADSDGI